MNTPKPRVKSSLGKYYVNEGTTNNIEETIFVLDRTRKFYLFDVIPFGAPRMTQSDKWRTNPDHLDPKKRQRLEVTKYYAFKNALVLQANIMKFELKTTLDAVYFTPMPDSWSKKKKERMNGFPCKSKPDTDNITKGIKDAFKKSDSEVWYEKAEHRWAYRGSIIIFE